MNAWNTGMRVNGTEYQCRFRCENGRAWAFLYKAERDWSCVAAFNVVAVRDEVGRQLRRLACHAVEDAYPGVHIPLEVWE